ncbi:MAG: hypothetical protein J1E96_06280 [Ruminococcus sp.]|nr:hypothetical protein [Ruminococcus sp.]
MSNKLVLRIGCVAGLIIAALIFGITAYVNIRKGKTTQYDERQVLARGAAAKASYAVAIFYMSTCFIVELMDLKWATLSVQMVLGALLSGTVYSVVCIFKNAYFGVKQKGYVTTIVTLIVCALSNMYLGFVNLGLREGLLFFTDGVLDLGSVFIIGPILLFIIVIALIIKAILEKRAGAEE